MSGCPGCRGARAWEELKTPPGARRARKTRPGPSRSTAVTTSRRSGRCPPSVINAPRREHSRKPDEAHETHRAHVPGPAQAGVVRPPGASWLGRMGQRDGQVRRRRMVAWPGEFIDRECIYRVNEQHPPIPRKNPGQFYAWQPRADPELTRRSARCECIYRINVDAHRFAIPSKTAEPVLLLAVLFAPRRATYCLSTDAQVVKTSFLLAAARVQSKLVLPLHNNYWSTRSALGNSADAVRRELGK